MTSIELDLHVSPKLCSIKNLKEIGYDDSQSASKTDKQRKENLKCVYQLVGRVKDRKDGQSGNNNYSTTMTTKNGLLKKIARVESAQPLSRMVCPATTTTKNGLLEETARVVISS